MKFHLLTLGQKNIYFNNKKILIQIYWPRIQIGNINNGGNRTIVHFNAATVFMFDLQKGLTKIENNGLQCGFKIFGFGFAFGLYEK